MSTPCVVSRRAFQWSERSRNALLKEVIMGDEQRTNRDDAQSGFGIDDDGAEEREERDDVFEDAMLSMDRSRRYTLGAASFTEEGTS
jgi:hypothetical protein